MAQDEKIEKDLQTYLDLEPNLERHNKLKMLKDIFNKHLDFNSNITHLITNKDLTNIKSDANVVMSRLPDKIYLSKKLVDENHSPIAIIEAFIYYLNRMQLLKRMLKFDFKD